MTGYWAVAQTVSTMEHQVRRDIEKTNHGAFVPTYARTWKVDGHPYRKEYPLLGGYVFFHTSGKDYAGIPDIHGVYGVLVSDATDLAGRAVRAPMRVSDEEMTRLMLAHATGEHNETSKPRYTKYYRPSAQVAERKRRRKPRPGKRIRNIAAT